MSRRDTHTRHISSRFPSQPSKDTSWVNPSLPPGASRLAQPKGSRRVPRPFIDTSGNSSGGWNLVDQWSMPRSGGVPDSGSLFIPDSDFTSFVVGLPNISPSTGSVFAYSYNNTTDEFDLIGNTQPATDDNGDESFGKSVVMSEEAEVIIVGEPRATNGSNTNAGRIFVFARDGGQNWTKRYQWYSDIKEQAAGYSMDITQLDEINKRWYLAVGEPMIYNPGTADLGKYPRMTSWRIEKDLSVPVSERAHKLTSDLNDNLYDMNQESQCGLSVANGNDGTAVVIGVPNLSPNAFVRVVSNGPETFDTSNDIDGPGGASTFGTSVDMSRDGTVIVVGDPGLGQVKVYYKNEADNYVQLGIIMSGDVGFGTSVAITNDSSSDSVDGTTIAIGDPNYDSPLLTNCGRIVVMEYAGGKWVQVFNNILGSSEEEYFGTVVAISPEGTSVFGLARGDNGRYAVYSTLTQAERQATW